MLPVLPQVLFFFSHPSFFFCKPDIDSFCRRRSSGARLYHRDNKGSDRTFWLSVYAMTLRLPLVCFFSDWKRSSLSSARIGLGCTILGSSDRENRCVLIQTGDFTTFPPICFYTRLLKPFLYHLPSTPRIEGAWPPPFFPLDFLSGIPQLTSPFFSETLRFLASHPR